MRPGPRAPYHRSTGNRHGRICREALGSGGRIDGDQSRAYWWVAAGQARRAVARAEHGDGRAGSARRAPVGQRGGPQRRGAAGFDAAAAAAVSVGGAEEDQTVAMIRPALAGAVGGRRRARAAPAPRVSATSTGRAPCSWRRASWGQNARACHGVAAGTGTDPTDGTLPGRCCELGSDAPSPPHTGGPLTAPSIMVEARRRAGRS